MKLWHDVMLNGSATIPPRRKPRDPGTVKTHLLGMAPMWSAWAAAGHNSLAEITPDLIDETLPH